MIYVIDKVRTTGKYIEFWFKDYHTQTFYEFHISGKHGYLSIAIAAADLEDHVLNNGVKGLCIEFDAKENIKRVYLQDAFCKKPPSGSSCSRVEGHEGPCAASETNPQFMI